MIAKANLNIGGVAYQFEFDDAKDLEAINKAIVLANPPRYCTVCDSGDGMFKLTSNRDKENNIYVNVKHAKCGAKAKLGSYKAGGYFWHRDFEKYEPKAGSNGENPDSNEE